MTKKLKVWMYVIIAISFLFTGCNLKSDDKKESQKDENKYQGIIEAVEVDINTKVPGKIGSINVEEGNSIAEDAVIATIESKELLAKKAQMDALISAAKSQYEASLSQVEGAKSQLSKAQNGARDQEIAQAQAMCDLAQKTFDRVNTLYEKGAVSAQKRDEAMAQLDVATQKLSLIREGASNDDISGAQAMVAAAMNGSNAAKAKYDQAIAGLSEVESYINDTIIKSPINGVITSLNSDKGELVSTGMAIATISDLKNMWIEINMDETKLSQITEGKSAKITIPSYKDKAFEGRVSKISKKPDFAVKKATNENGNYDIVSYAVKVKLENVDNILRPGMTAFVEFEK